MPIATCVYAVAFIATTTAALLFGYLRFQQAAEESERLDDSEPSRQDYPKAA